MLRRAPTYRVEKEGGEEEEEEEERGPRLLLCLGLGCLGLRI